MRLYYIQPLIAGYRIPIINALKSAHDITLVASFTSDVFLAGFKNEPMENFKTINSPVRSFFNGKISIQKNVSFLSIKKIDAVLSFADPRFISFWILLFRCFIFNKKFYSHGQGLYSYPNPGLIRGLIYRLMVSLSSKYICYSEISRQSLLGIGCNPQKLIVADNSLELDAFVPPRCKHINESGILYIGRIRQDCKLDKLIQAVDMLNSSGSNIVLHVIGSGILETQYRKQFEEYSFIIWHGAIYDDAKIAEISKECRIGCYPGDAGLSVVHYFGLSLPPLVHNDMCMHMGPEPSYINDNINGFLFDRNGGAFSIADKIQEIWNKNSSDMLSIISSAFESYKSLNEPSIGTKFVNILANN